jgi:UDP-N-acetylglucosamine--N-acetylmuramyl-(pentapeptide) pyrophosphoryl-undecaprenol N-acetylglucosamine transferase
VRQAFFEIPAATSDTPTLLVFGGSQGAHAINQVLMESAALLRERVPRLRIVHQTGERDYNDAAAAYAGLGGSIEVFKFIDDMPAFFGRADLLLCRSGASTVAEITAAGKPAVFIPFPRAADDHQKRNAEALARAGAAVMIEESRLNRDVLVETVVSLLSDRPRLERMGRAARQLSHPDAARDIAAMAARVAGVLT